MAAGRGSREIPASWRDVAPRGARPAVRAAVLGLFSAGWARSGRLRSALRRPRVHIVCLHDLFPDEEDPFRRLLRRLAEDHEFIAYGEAVRRINAGDFPRPSVAFSFDDGFRTTLAGARILEEFGARGCFFVCPPMLGERSAEARARFCRERLLMATREFFVWSDAESLLAAGHEVGGHTLTHRRLSETGEGELDDEVGGCRQSLLAGLGRADHFAWPFGHFDDMSAAGMRAVLGAGFTSCASSERGCHVARSRGALCLRRENTVAAWPSGHVAYFMARSASRASSRDNDFPWAASRARLEAPAPDKTVG